MSATTIWTPASPTSGSADYDGAYAWLCSVTVEATGWLQTITLRAGSAGLTGVIGLYADNGGTPAGGTLLTTCTTVVTPAGSAPTPKLGLLQPIWVTVGTVLWVVIQLQATSSLIKLGAGTCYRFANTYGSFPAVCPAVNLSGLPFVTGGYQYADPAQALWFPQYMLDENSAYAFPGVRPWEYSRSTTTLCTEILNNSTYTLICGYVLAWEGGFTLEAGTYVIWFRSWSDLDSTLQQVTLLADSTAFTSAVLSASSTFETGVPFEVTVPTDTAILASLIVQLKMKAGLAATPNGYARPIHADNFAGVLKGSTALQRLSFRSSFESPLVQAHANPAIAFITRPEFMDLLSGVYADDVLTLTRYDDTEKLAAHSATNPTAQSLGYASANIDRLAGTSRVIQFTPDVDRRLKAKNNTYLVLSVAAPDGTAVGSTAWEMVLDVDIPVLLSLAGMTALTPERTSYLEPTLEWYDPNQGQSTHWRAKIYRESDDVLMWDSGETAVGAMQVLIPVAAGLASTTTYYAIVTVMKGSAGSDWSIDSEPGYFEIDDTSTTVKIISHEGTADAPEVITTLTPTFDWQFLKPQHSCDICMNDAADESIVYQSGWMVTADQSWEIPAI